MKTVKPDKKSLFAYICVSFFAAVLLGWFAYFLGERTELPLEIDFYIFLSLAFFLITCLYVLLAFQKSNANIWRYLVCDSYSYLSIFLFYAMQIGWRQLGIISLFDAFYLVIVGLRLLLLIGIIIDNISIDENNTKVIFALALVFSILLIPYVSINDSNSSDISGYANNSTLYLYRILLCFIFAWVAREIFQLMIKIDNRFHEVFFTWSVIIFSSPFIFHNLKIIYFALTFAFFYSGYNLLINSNYSIFSISIILIILLLSAIMFDPKVSILLFSLLAYFLHCQYKLTFPICLGIAMLWPIGMFGALFGLSFHHELIAFADINTIFREIQIFLIDRDAGILFSTPFLMLGFAGMFHVWRKKAVYTFLSVALLSYIIATIFGIYRYSEGKTSFSLCAPIVLLATPFIPETLNRCKGLIPSMLLGFTVIWTVSFSFFSLLSQNSTSALLQKITEFSNPAFIRIFPTYLSWPPDFYISRFLWLGIFILILGFFSLLKENNEISFITFLHRRSDSFVLFPVIIGFLFIALMLYTAPEMRRADLGLTYAEAEKQVPFKTVFKHPQLTDKLVIISSLSNSINVEQGQTIAFIEIETTQEAKLNLPFNAGIHSAEWAHDRPDVLKVIQHDKAPIAYSWPQIYEETGESYSAFRYKGEVELPSPQTVKAILFRDIGVCQVNVSSIKCVGHEVYFSFPATLNINQNEVVLSTNKDNFKWHINDIQSYRKMYISSRLTNAISVKQNTPIARIAIETMSGNLLTNDIIAGIDTAEWAYRRSDVLVNVEHQPANFYPKLEEPPIIDSKFEGDSFIQTYFFDENFVPIYVFIELLPHFQKEYPNTQLSIQNIIFR